MLRTYAPAAIALLAIVGLTIPEAMYSDRFTGTAMTAEEFGKRFANVPKEVGSWSGVDMKEEADTLKMAGAVRHVSRRYTDDAGHTVDLWLIVGHSRDICRHTPNICYPSHGYSQKGAVVKQQVVPPSSPDDVATFFTAKFTDDRPSGGRGYSRVFWAWNGNEDGKYKWEAPEAKSLWSFLPMRSAGPKTYYGNNTALYKIYFTADTNLDETVGDSIAIEFAKLMLPEINRALFPERYPDAVKAEEADESTDAAETEATAAPADAAPTAD